MVYLKGVKMTQGEYEKQCRKNKTEDNYRDPRKTWNHIKYLNRKYGYPFGRLHDYDYREGDYYIDEVMEIAGYFGIEYEEFFIPAVNIENLFKSRFKNVVSLC